MQDRIEETKKSYNILIDAGDNFDHSIDALSESSYDLRDVLFQVRGYLNYNFSKRLSKSKGNLLEVLRNNYELASGNLFMSGKEILNEYFPKRYKSLYDAAYRVFFALEKYSDRRLVLKDGWDKYRTGPSTAASPLTVEQEVEALLRDLPKEMYEELSADKNLSLLERVRKAREYFVNKINEYDKSAKALFDSRVSHETDGLSKPGGGLGMFVSDKTSRYLRAIDARYAHEKLRDTAIDLEERLTEDKKKIGAGSPLTFSGVKDIALGALAAAQEVNEEGEVFSRALNLYDKFKERKFETVAQLEDWLKQEEEFLNENPTHLSPEDEGQFITIIDLLLKVIKKSLGNLSALKKQSPVASPLEYDRATTIEGYITGAITLSDAIKYLVASQGEQQINNNEAMSILVAAELAVEYNLSEPAREAIKGYLTGTWVKMTAKETIVRFNPGITQHQARKILQEAEKIARSAGLPLTGVSSAIGTQEGVSVAQKRGGIDFTDRAMRIKLERVGSFASSALVLPEIANVEALDLDKEFEQIQVMVSSSIRPSDTRILEFAAACYYRGEFDTRLEQVSSCVKAAHLADERLGKDSSDTLRLATMLPDALYGG